MRRFTTTLAILTALLFLGGCDSDKKTPAEPTGQGHIQPPSLNDEKPPAKPPPSVVSLGGRIVRDDQGKPISATLAKTNIVDADLVVVADMTTLEGLNLYATGITDDGLIHLAKLTQLKWLNLSDTQVGDAGLAHLSPLTNLESLDLEGLRITDAGLEHLAGLTRLKMLNLEATRVTDQGVDLLRQSLPGLQVLR